MNMGDGIVIPHLGILVTTFCNLNCRNCADLIPKRENYIYEFEDIVSDLSRLLDNVSSIEEVLIIGGETLMYPRLEEIIDFCGSCDKIHKLIITSNGTIQPSDDLMECIERNQVCMRISGYPEHVAPNRVDILESFAAHGISTEDLRNMTWADMGDRKKRNHTEAELQQIFMTCAMANCVTLQKDGRIFYCSRSMSAYETDLYPDIPAEEYIDVRHEEDLAASIDRFFHIPYLTTCDYCDGISCATTKYYPAATQILDKGIFLELLGLVSSLHSDREHADVIVVAISRILIDYATDLYDLDDYLICMRAIEEFLTTHGDEAFDRLLESMIRLTNSITDDYNFVASDDVAFTRENQNHSSRNRITVGRVGGRGTEELLFDDAEILEEFHKRYSLDYAEYNRVFLETEFERLESEDITCAVCGLSYTQSGIVQELMPVGTVNLSVTGQDIPYSLLMARKAIEIRPEIRTLIIPMTYYHGFYDISSDDAFIHKDIVRRVNIPLLGEARNYDSSVEYVIAASEEPTLEIYDRIFDFHEVQKEVEAGIREYLVDKDFFNEIYPQSPFGGLKFDYKTLSEEERFQSAKITAELNERVVTSSGQEEVAKYLRELLPELTKDGRRVIFFLPPMTKYLYAAYSDELKNNFRDQTLPLLSEFDNVFFYDFAQHEIFMENDFNDYEHLNYNGGVKLTKLLAELIER